MAPKFSWKLLRKFHEKLSSKLSWKPLSFQPSVEAAAASMEIRPKIRGSAFVEAVESVEASEEALPWKLSWELP